MDRYTIKNINNFLTLHTLSVGKSSIEIIPEKGALLNSLNFDGQQLIDRYNTIDEFEKLDWAKSALLFPFPNRLKNGKYLWKNKLYQFPINLPPNAIHGFGMYETFNIVKTSFEQDFSAIELSYIYQKNYEFYPFSFEISIAYKLYENRLDVKYSAKNIDNQTIPIGLGWHPYFSLGGNVKDWEITMPITQKIEVDENMIPNGKKTLFSVFEKPIQIGDIGLDTCFDLIQNNKFELELRNNNVVLNYSQSSENHQFRYVQLFIPPNRTCLAIEPMTCSIDAFNQQKELVSIDPQYSVGGNINIHWTPK